MSWSPGSAVPMNTRRRPSRRALASAKPLFPHRTPPPTSTSTLRPFPRRLPGDVRHAGPAVHLPGHDKKRIAEAVEVPDRRRIEGFAFLERNDQLLGAADLASRHVQRRGGL